MICRPRCQRNNPRALRYTGPDTMNAWMTEAVRLAYLQAPRLTPKHACDLADDLYKACAEFRTPDEAVGGFFASMPSGWNALPAQAEVH